ncbi:hypothetical protein HOLleu_43324 [Holothuria leucospilota]|uniref:Uncharacterized protein n=1 Tax=Holothuria leucospilota TaxID=206669 RepID=A0A9Q1BBN3_HOLLE|nr:hypothetical protein HOLleu_43324 [Holothuria leucospilota]
MILGCVKTAGRWTVTLKNAGDAELLQAKSLPCAIVIGGIHLRLKHNGQCLVCNNCLSEDHFKRCPLYLCSSCGQQNRAIQYVH